MPVPSCVDVRPVLTSSQAALPSFMVAPLRDAHTRFLILWPCPCPEGLRTPPITANTRFIALHCGCALHLKDCTCLPSLWLHHITGDALLRSAPTSSSQFGCCASLRLPPFPPRFDAFSGEEKEIKRSGNEVCAHAQLFTPFLGGAHFTLLRLTREYLYSLQYMSCTRLSIDLLH